MQGAQSSRYADDRAHPLYSIGRFKMSFSKEIVDYIGCYNAPVRNWRSHALFQTERLFFKFHNSALVGQVTGRTIARNPDLEWFR